jgi:3-hydroxyisobutyrate dehydrogenase-like beta-hydroxyacid dehydrogenase
MTVIDCTTGEPDVVLAEAEAAAAAGARYADCPLARTPVEAEKGTLNVMVGAEPAVFEDVRPILECFCENIFNVGPVGSGTRMKLINNLITMGQAALIAEAIAACNANGVDLRVFYDIISKGGGNSGIFQMIVPDFIESGSCDGMKFSIANASKDLGYFNRMADSVSMAAPMGMAVQERLETAGAIGFSDGLVGHLVAAALKLNQLEDGDREPQRAQTGA